MDGASGDGGTKSAGRLRCAIGRSGGARCGECGACYRRQTPERAGQRLRGHKKARERDRFVSRSRTNKPIAFSATSRVSAVAAPGPNPHAQNELRVEPVTQPRPNPAEYEAIKSLAGGGQGVAFLAQHKITQQRVVLKCVFKRHQNAAEHEAAMLQKLQSHTNIVEYYNTTNIPWSLPPLPEETIKDFGNVEFSSAALVLKFARDGDLLRYLEGGERVRQPAARLQSAPHLPADPRRAAARARARRGPVRPQAR